MLSCRVPLRGRFRPFNPDFGGFVGSFCNIRMWRGLDSGYFRDSEDGWDGAREKALWSEGGWIECVADVRDWRRRADLDAVRAAT